MPRREFLRTSDPEWLRLGRRGSAVFLAVGCTLIVVWQADAIRNIDRVDTSYRIHPAMNGFVPKHALKYFSFLYYTGKFPVAREGPLPVWNEATARSLLESGPELRNELEHGGVYLRTGDLGKILLLYPAAWWNGSPHEASLLLFNRFLGVGSLLALFVSFALLEHRLLGSVLVAVLGSNPFTLFELYANNDIFGLAIPVASYMLALHAPLLMGRWRGWGTLGLAISSGGGELCS